MKLYPLYGAGGMGVLQMELRGCGASPGVTIGRLHYVRRAALPVVPRRVSDLGAEVARFEAACTLAGEQLDTLATSTAEKLGAENARLFESHRMMLEDEEFRAEVAGRIATENVCAEYAVQQVSEALLLTFAELKDDYMRQRVADVRDVAYRVLNILLGIPQAELAPDEPRVMAAADFAPSETAQFDRRLVLGILTAGGSSNSHTAIFARTMGIPAITGLGEELGMELEGRMVALDGASGLVVIDPDEETLRALHDRQTQDALARQALTRLKGVPAVTVSGRRVRLFANIGGASDAFAAMDNDAEGVGLFRSEFLFPGQASAPGEQAQYETYRRVAEILDGKTVVIRTLDIGADKQAAGLSLPGETNPALGLRGIRLCLQRPALFKTQLRAIYRASAHGKLSIMLPMVTREDEILRTRQLAAQVQDELRSEGIPFDEAMPLGMMVETPVAAILSDALAAHVDFFSIGTNDLTQYTLALDRDNAAVQSLYDTHNEAVLRLVERTVQNGHAAGIPVGICGELAADHHLTHRFISMGVDELSVPPTQILPLRAHINSLP